MRDEEKLLRIKMNELEKKKNQCSQEMDMKQRTIQQLKVSDFLKGGLSRVYIFQCLKKSVFLIPNSLLAFSVIEKLVKIK